MALLDFAEAHRKSYPPPLTGNKLWILAETQAVTTHVAVHEITLPFTNWF